MIADIMEIPGDLSQFTVPLGIPHGFQNIRSRLGYSGYVSKAVFRISQGDQGFVRLGNVSFDGFVVFDIFKCNHMY